MSSWFSEALMLSSQPCLCAKLKAILRPFIVHALNLKKTKPKHQDTKRVLYDTSRTTDGLNIGSML